MQAIIPTPIYTAIPNLKIRPPSSTCCDIPIINEERIMAKVLNVTKPSTRLSWGLKAFLLYLAVIRNYI